MGTSKDNLINQIFEFKTQLDYIKRKYPQVYEESESYYAEILEEE